MTILIKKRKFGPKSKSKSNEANTFKYESFSKKLSKIDIETFLDSITTISNNETLALDTFSHFHSGLEHFKELDCTTEFSDFYHKVSPLCLTFPLLVFNKDAIVDSLLSSITPSISFITLLACIMKDLREEFYPYLHRTIPILYEILDKTQDISIIQHLFHTLLCLFKFLLNSILSNLESFLPIILQFLSHTRPIFRNLSSVLVSYLFRKICSQQLFNESCLYILEFFLSNNLPIDVLPILFSNSMKHTTYKHHHLSLYASSFFESLLSIFHTRSCIEQDFSIICHTILSLLYEKDSEFCEQIWSMILDTRSLWQNPNDHFYLLLIRMMYLGQGSYFPHAMHSRVISIIKKDIHLLSLSILYELLLSLFLNIQDHESVIDLYRYVSTLNLEDSKYRFVLYQLLDNPPVGFIQSDIDHLNGSLPDHLIQYILMKQHDPLPTWIKDLANIDNTILDQVWKDLDKSCLIDRVALFHHIYKNNPISNPLIIAWIKSKLDSTPLNPLQWWIIISLLETLLYDESLLSILHGLWPELSGKSPRFLEYLLSIKYSLSISKIDLYHLLLSNNESIVKNSLLLLLNLQLDQNIINHMITICNIPCTLDTFRTKLVLIDQLMNMNISHDIAATIFHFLFGILFISFQLVHPPVIKHIANLASKYPIEFWECFQYAISIHEQGFHYDIPESLYLMINNGQNWVSDLAQKRSKLSNTLPYSHDTGLHKYSIVSEYYYDHSSIGLLYLLRIHYNENIHRSNSFISRQCYALLSYISTYRVSIMLQNGIEYIISFLMKHIKAHLPKDLIKALSMVLQTSKYNLNESDKKYLLSLLTKPGSKEQQQCIIECFQCNASEMEYLVNMISSKDISSIIEPVSDNDVFLTLLANVIYSKMMIKKNDHMKVIRWIACNGSIHLSKRIYDIIVTLANHNPVKFLSLMEPFCNVLIGYYRNKVKGSEELLNDCLNNYILELNPPTRYWKEWLGNIMLSILGCISIDTDVIRRKVIHPILKKPIKRSFLIVFYEFILSLDQSILCDPILLEHIIQSIDMIPTNMLCSLLESINISEKTIESLIMKCLFDHNSSQVHEFALIVYYNRVTIHSMQWSINERSKVLTLTLNLLFQPSKIKSNHLDILKHIVLEELSCISIDPSINDSKVKLIYRLFRSFDDRDWLLLVLKKLGNEEAIYNVVYEMNSKESCIDEKIKYITLSNELEAFLLIQNLVYYKKNCRWIKAFLMNDNIVKYHHKIIPFVLSLCKKERDESNEYWDLLDWMIQSKSSLFPDSLAKLCSSPFLTYLRPCNNDHHKKQKSLSRICESEWTLDLSQPWIKFFLSISIQSTRIYESTKSNHSHAPLIDQSIKTSSYLISILSKNDDSIMIHWIIQVLEWWKSSFDNDSKHDFSLHRNTLLKFLLQLINEAFFSKTCINENMIALIKDSLMPSLLEKITSKKAKNEISLYSNSMSKQKDTSTRNISVLQSNIVECCCKLLLLVPSDDYVKNHLMKIVLDICSFLKSRVEHIRNESRHALMNIVSLFGFQYLGFIIKQVEHVLFNRSKNSHHGGFLKHVLGYTTWALLDSLKNITNPILDTDTVSNIMNILLEDLFGIISIEKDDEQWAGKCKEVRQKKGLDSIGLLSRYISPIFIPLFMNKIESRINTMYMIDEKVWINRIKDIFAISAKNIPLSIDVIHFKVIHSLVNQSSENKIPSNLSLEFGLDLLSRMLKIISALPDVNDPNNKQGLLSLLQPFVQPLAHIIEFYEKHEEQIQSKSFQILLQFEHIVPELLLNQKNHNQMILQSAIKYLIHVQICSETSQVMIKCCQWIVRHSSLLDEEDIKILSSEFLSRIMEVTTMPFKRSFVPLIQVILDRKLALSQVYDMMDIFRDKWILMEESETIPDNPLNIIYIKSFLHSFPITKAKKTKIYQYFIDNMNHSWPIVRRNVCIFLGECCRLWNQCKNDDDDEWLSILFLHTTLALVNEQESSVKNEIISLFKIYFEYVILKDDLLEGCLELINNWIDGSGNDKLLRSSMQILKLLLPFAYKANIDNDKILLIKKQIKNCHEMMEKSLVHNNK